jgi:hypothetical protein
VNRAFPTFSRICFFFLLTLRSSNLSLLSASSLLCFSSVHIVGRLTSNLPSTKMVRLQIKQPRGESKSGFYIPKSMLSHVPSPYEMAFSMGAPIFTSGQVDVFLKSLAEVYRQDLTERSPGRNKRD